MTDEQAKIISDAIKSIANGDQYRATGLELLSMALAGEGLINPLGQALVQIADAINNLADAVRDASGRA